MVLGKLDSSVQSLSHVWPFANPWTAAHQASLCIKNSWNLLKLMSIKLLMPSNHLILCPHFLLLLSIFPSIKVFSSESLLCIWWPNYWSFSFSISPSNEYSGLISFRIDWFDLLAGKGTLKNLRQHHNSKVSILCCSTWYHLSYQGASLVAQTVKNLTTIQETQVEALDWEDPLEKGLKTHPSILAWRMPWTEDPARLQSIGSQRVRHN